MGFFVLSYLCMAVFLAAVVFRICRQASLPVHVRWELYPVQHESAAKAAYGGSYLEEVDWWEKKREGSLLNEALYMVPEILFIRGLWKTNRRLWWVSFPFHFGLYLMIATFSLMLVHAVLTLGGAAGSAWGSLVAWLYSLTGWTGLILGTTGSLGLLFRRRTDPDLKRYSTPADELNLLFIALFFLAALAAALSDPLLDGGRAYVLGLLTGGGAPSGYRPGKNLAGGAAIVLASLLTAYIPLTHMSHMFMKFFLYHQVKWDDAPNRPGSPIESAIAHNLSLRPTWQAPHVDADGKKTWGEIAAAPPKEMK